MGAVSSGVPRYALFDEDETDGKDLSTLAPSCHIKWEGVFSERTGVQADVVVLGFGDQAVPFLLGRMVEPSSGGYAKVASIDVSVPEELATPYKKVRANQTCDIYCLQAGGSDTGVVECGVCVVACDIPLGPHEAVVWGDFVTAAITGYSRVIVLESGRHLELFADDAGEANELRCLMTHEARKSLGGRGPACPILAGPNMISGAAGHVMALCQYAHTAATAYVAYRDAQDIDMASLHIFEAAIKADDRLSVEHAVGDNEKALLTEKSFAAAVKRAQRFSTPQSLYA